MGRAARPARETVGRVVADIVGQQTGLPERAPDRPVPGSRSSPHLGRVPEEIRVTRPRRLYERVGQAMKPSAFSQSETTWATDSPLTSTFSLSWRIVSSSSWAMIGSRIAKMLGYLPAASPFMVGAGL